MSEWHWTPSEIGGLTLAQVVCLSQKKPPKPYLREIHSEADVEALHAEIRGMELAFSEPMPKG